MHKLVNPILLHYFAAKIVLKLLKLQTLDTNRMCKVALRSFTQLSIKKKMTNSTQTKNIYVFLIKYFLVWLICFTLGFSFFRTKKTKNFDQVCPFKHRGREKCKKYLRYEPWRNWFIWWWWRFVLLLLHFGLVLTSVRCFFVIIEFLWFKGSSFKGVS